MTELRYPSDDFPAPVGCASSRRSGGSRCRTSGCRSRSAARSTRGVHPNVIVTVSRIRAEQTLDDAHAEVLRKLRPMPRLRELDGGEVDVDGLPGRWLEASFKGGGGRSSCRRCARSWSRAARGRPRADDGDVHADAAPVGRGEIRAVRRASASTADPRRYIRPDRKTGYPAGETGVRLVTEERVE